MMIRNGANVSQGQSPKDKTLYSVINASHPCSKKDARIGKHVHLHQVWQLSNARGIRCRHAGIDYCLQ